MEKPHTERDKRTKIPRERGKDGGQRNPNNLPLLLLCPTERRLVPPWAEEQLVPGIPVPQGSSTSAQSSPPVQGKNSPPIQYIENKKTDKCSKRMSLMGIALTRASKFPYTPTVSQLRKLAIISHSQESSK